MTEPIPAQDPILAICYDFDKTLSPDDMQAQGYIQSVGYDVDAFWRESNALAAENGMDQNLAYMYFMAVKAQGKLVLNRKALQDYGSRVKLYPGVDSWFERINAWGKKHGVAVEHYIISSGLREMIEGNKISRHFKEIYASSFFYDKDGVAVWPAQAVNYTNKTQFLFRIEKGVLGVNDPRVNDYFSPDHLRVPFRNMVYIGDSDTDIPCMKLVNSYGGYAIGVYDAESGDKTKVYKMLKEKRIKYFVPSDYRKGQPLEQLLKDIIGRTKTNEILEMAHFSCENEMQGKKNPVEKKQS